MAGCLCLRPRFAVELTACLPLRHQQRCSVPKSPTVRAIASTVYRHNVGRSLPLTLRNPSFNKFKLIEVGFGSFASVWRCLSYFRFPPPSRHFQGGSAGPKSATEVGERCGNSPGGSIVVQCGEIAALPEPALLVFSISSSGLLNAGALRIQSRPRLLLRRAGG